MDVQDPEACDETEARNTENLHFPRLCLPDFNNTPRNQ